MQADWTTNTNIYGFLARLWIAELDQATIEQLSEGELRDAWDELGGVIPQFDDAESTVDELAIEYCACFLGPKGHLPPHQSVVSHSRFQGDCLGQLQQFIDIIGMPEGPLFQQQQMLDHAGILFALMQRIYAFGSQCKSEQLESVTQLRAQFFDTHLSWIIKYCEVATNNTQSDFYRSLFQVTADFLRSESANQPTPAL